MTCEGVIRYVEDEGIRRGEWSGSARGKCEKELKRVVSKGQERV